MKRKCRCKKILGRDKIWVHLSGCPDSIYTKDYNKLPWYKKIFARDPTSLYIDIENASWRLKKTY